MGKETGFLEHDRREPDKRPVEERVRDWREIPERLPEDDLRTQASRCMDCGIPYCHSFGCPVANRIPEFNDALHRGHWRRALDLLHATNNFPEVTGRVCPAPCESACTLAINIDPVSIRQIELQLVERGFEEGYIRPEMPPERTGRRVAVVGSGPAGLAAAQELARAGHDVTVFEKSDRIGGILRYGIPDFKLEKWVIDRRLDQMRAEGVDFETQVEVGVDISARYLRRTFDAVLLTAGAGVPRDLTVPGRGLEGIHFAMPYLVQQNRVNAGEEVPDKERITAAGKDVVVIGGGDTGSDCVGTARRQGAKSITQIEILPEPPAERALDDPWPTWPTIMRTSTSHEEGCERIWSVLTKEFLGLGVDVRAVRCVRIAWGEPDDRGKRSFEEVPDTQFELPAQLVLLALGFLRTEHGKLVRDMDIERDPRGNIIVDESYRTSAEGVFAAGDATTGASLVVRAISHGRRAAEAINRHLRNTAPPREDTS
jgi:NAD(P)H-dependent glutamate synthase small subunit